MRSTGELAFAWAKASGIIGKTFIGSRCSLLFSVSRLSELDRLLFPDDPSDLPERELSLVLERRISDRAVSRTLRIVSVFSSPPAAVERIVSAYEYSALSRCLAAVVSGDRQCPDAPKLGAFGTVRYDAYPDVAKMTAGTEFSWIAEALAGGASLVDMETELDKRYYSSLWEGIGALSGADRAVFEELIAEEIELKNIVWALRLRSYYGIEGAELERRLVDVKRNGGSLADEARRTAGFALDRRADWKRWKRRYLLNDEVAGESWKADPRRVQNLAAGRAFRLARSLFRGNPFSLGSIACFAKLMQFEEDLLTSVAEGLVLGIAPKDVVASLGVGS